jgi:hypothetical protein
MRGSGPHHDHHAIYRGGRGLVDRSGNGHAAGGIKGQILAATTTGIIAVDEPLA